MKKFEMNLKKGVQEIIKYPKNEEGIKGFSLFSTKSEQ